MCQAMTGHSRAEQFDPAFAVDRSDFTTDEGYVLSVALVHSVHADFLWKSTHDICNAQPLLTKQKHSKSNKSTNLVGIVENAACESV